jgi:hypothetical protein
MKTTKTERAIEFFRRMESLGIDYSTAQRLRRIEMTLHRWSERECNGEIERDDNGKLTQWCEVNGARRQIYGTVPDKESGALARLASIMAEFPALWSYHQTDPRGCALYVGRKADLTSEYPLECQYSRGVAVCF